MPKSQMINPEDVRKPSKVEFKPVPVNQYKKTVKEELSRYSKDDMVRIQRDMMVIRALRICSTD